MTQKGRPNKLFGTEDAVRSFKSLKCYRILLPDASDKAISDVIRQAINCEEHAVAYLRFKLLSREQKYAAKEKECFAIVWVIDSLRYYPSEKTFEILTDQNILALLNEMQIKNPRLLRWCLAIQSYNFIIKKRSGKQHGNVDGLLRMPLKYVGIRRQKIQVCLVHFMC
ncbi:hypothetical protein ACJMK2_036410 [Sinanodonta woodiana]|uniref:Reverse transcriptase RNase H-like domain-containing protein n=1 Tax=Sinanodonta woodiana TaxID=1069815 RepID=A0ABD3WH51_SINWO